MNELNNDLNESAQVSQSLSAVLFDLDGTLVDTAPDFAAILTIMRARRQLAALPYEQVHATVSDGARALVTLAFGLEEADEGFDELRSELLELYSQHLADASRLYPGMEEVLTTLRERDIPWGIVTNKPSAYAFPLLEKLGLEAGTCICADHVVERKPAPEPILRACADLQVDAGDAIYLGDHRRDIEAGRSAGARTVACSYGYIHPEDPVAQWEADFTIAAPLEFLSILEQL